MNKELKILGVVVAFTLVLYWGVEPFAHSKMHKHVEGDEFKYSDLKEVSVKGDASRGEALASACVGCHSIEVKGMPGPNGML